MENTRGKMKKFCKLCNRNCTLCKIGDHENGNCSEVIICIAKFSKVTLKTLNI